MLHYLLQTSLLFSLFYLAYRWVFFGTARFRFNRLFLLLSYPLAIILPLFPWSRILEVKTTTWMPLLQPDILTETSKYQGFTTAESPTAAIDLAVSPLSTVDWPATILLIYLIGIALFLLAYLFRLHALKRLTKGRILVSNDQLPIKAAGKKFRLYTLPATKKFAATHGACIYVSPNLLQSPDLDLILSHEYAHVTQYHSIDLFMAEVGTALFWFNPLAWLHRKSLRLNLEFLADTAVLEQGNSRKKYQFSLLQFCERFVPQPALSFSQSPLKTRIAMMKTKQKSTPVYLLLLSAVLLLGGITTACTANQKTANNELATSTAPFTQTFSNYSGWKAAHSLLQANYPNHQKEYFVNGAPAQNGIVPTFDDIQTVEISANTKAENLVTVSFTSKTDKWTTALGKHLVNYDDQFESDIYVEQTKKLFGGELDNFYAVTYFKENTDLRGILDFHKEEFPVVNRTFYLNDQLATEDLLSIPPHEIKTIVLASTVTDAKKVIINVLTQAK